MVEPKTFCEFEMMSVPEGNYANAPHRVEYRCRTHDTTGFRPDSTITEFGAFTLCPVGKVEFAVERGLERIEAHIRKRMGELDALDPERR